MKQTVIMLVFFVISIFFPLTLGFARAIPAAPQYLSDSLNQCEDDNLKGNLMCVKVEDDMFNVTFDCHLNNLRRAELALQYPNFPKKMKHLSIQNCETLILDMRCDQLSKSPHEEVTSRVHLSHLHIVNMIDLVVITTRYFLTSKKENMGHFGNMPSEEFTDTVPIEKQWHITINRYQDFMGGDKLYDSIEEKENYYVNDLITDSIKSVTFENIKYANFEESQIPLRLFRCSFINKNTTLKKIKMINIGDMEFSGFSEDYTDMQEFLMNNVTPIILGKDNPLRINNTQAVVEIINSDLTENSQFFEGNVSKLIVKGNLMNKIDEKGFNFVADDFVFSGNVIDNMAKHSLYGDSHTAEITNNKIHIAEHEALTGLSLKFSQPTAHHIKRIYNFSNNQIDILSSRALIIMPLEVTSERSYYDSIIITNNSINCSCQNSAWFALLSQFRYMINPFTSSFWIKTSNQNKCLNMPKCSLAHVLSNHAELCEHDYKCPEKVFPFNSSTNYINELEETLRNTLRVNQEISGTNLKIFQVLESRNNNEHGSILTVNTLCLVVLMVFFGGGLGYLVLRTADTLTDQKSLLSGDIEISPEISPTS